MASDPLLAQLDIARKLAEDALKTTQRFIKSRTLARALSIDMDLSKRPEQVIARLTIPHYWAVYYHDGRGPVKPVRGKFLVWFKSISDDPRVNGGLDYPVRESDVKRLNLSKAQFRRLLRQGKLIVATRAKPFRGVKFFDKMARGLPGRTGRIALPIFRRFITGWLREAGLLSVRKTIRLR